MPQDEAVRLRVNEIFYSVQGESTHAGRPCVFVRLTGCPLRCAYCDTEYAFHGGDWMRLEEVLAAVRAQLDETTFAAAWAEGWAMSLEQAIAYALNTTSSATTYSQPSTTI